MQLLTIIDNDLSMRITALDYNAADLHVCRLDAGHQDAVALHKLSEGVANGVACPPDPYGLHHARVAELTHAQLPVEQLHAVSDSHTDPPCQQAILRGFTD